MDKSTKWLIIIISGLVLFGFFSFLFLFTFLKGIGDFNAEEITGSGDRIGVVELDGVIVESKEIVRQLKKYHEDRSIRGILLRVDSPGGGVVASQEIFEEVKKSRDRKPLVVSMGSLAASGGYYVSCPANRIVANPGTLTGSIGVISQFFRYDSLLGKIGVGVSTIKSGKLKDAGSPYRAMDDADKKYFQSLMDDVHRQFVSAVETERKLPRQSVMKMADGRVFTGTEALKLGLIDTIGTYEDAIMITAGLAGIRGKPSVVRERKRGLSIFDQLLGRSKVAGLLGLRDDLLDQTILQYRMIESY